MKVRFRNLVDIVLGNFGRYSQETELEVLRPNIWRELIKI